MATIIQSKTGFSTLVKHIQGIFLRTDIFSCKFNALNGHESTRYFQNIFFVSNVFGWMQNGILEWDSNLALSDLRKNIIFQKLFLMEHQQNVFRSNFFLHFPSNSEFIFFFSKCIFSIPRELSW